MVIHSQFGILLILFFTESTAVGFFLHQLLNSHTQRSCYQFQIAQTITVPVLDLADLRLAEADHCAELFLRESFPFPVLSHSVSYQSHHLFLVDLRVDSTAERTRRSIAYLEYLWRRHLASDRNHYSFYSPKTPAPGIGCGSTPHRVAQRLRHNNGGRLLECWYRRVLVFHSGCRARWSSFSLV